MAETSRTGADALVEALIGAGVDHVFGLPGDTGVDLYDSMCQAPALHHIMCRDERHAAIMADVYARSSNKLGVVEVSSGGGATYCVGGLGEPFAASTPLLVLSSDIHAGSRNTGALTELDQERLFSGVTKWARRVECADDIPSLLAEAIEVATSGRPAPVALILPEDVLAAETGTPAMRVKTTIPAHRSSGDGAGIQAIARGLVEASQPAIVAGGGIHLSAAYEELADLAESAAVPVATTIHGKGTYPESAPWSLGVVGGNGGRPYVNEYLASADFVLLVGTRANATDTNGFRSPPRTADIAQIDIDEDRAGRNFPGSIGVVADAKTALAGITSAMGSRSNGRTALRRDLARLREVWGKLKSPSVPKGTVHPLGLLEALRRRFGADALIVSDCGTPTPFLAAHWETVTPGRRMLVARGHGPMGYAIPGAVGAAIANPGERILAITTDGSLCMACGELETVKRMSLPITFVQLTNGSFGWIKMLQHLYHDGRYFGVDLGAVDACAIARGFGLPARRVDCEPGLEDALRGHTDGKSGPAFVEVMIPDMPELDPPVASWTAARAGTDTVRPVY